MSERIRFGPSGNSKSFYDEGHKHSREMPEWLR
ncbi:MAG: endonuclease IV, partial [Clostridiales bacterium]|nr:endonuclease IV [Clostridiales bacterium]